MHYFIFFILYFSDESGLVTTFDFQTCVDRLRSVPSCMEPSYVLPLACHSVRLRHMQYESSIKNSTHVKVKGKPNVPECHDSTLVLLERNKGLKCLKDSWQTDKTLGLIVATMDRWYLYSLPKDMWTQIHVSPLPQDFVVDERKGRIYLLTFDRKHHLFRIEITTSVTMFNKLVLCAKYMKEGYPHNLVRDHKLHVLFVTTSMPAKTKVNLYKIIESTRKVYLVRRLSSAHIHSLTINPEGRNVDMLSDRAGVTEQMISSETMYGLRYDRKSKNTIVQITYRGIVEAIKQNQLGYINSLVYDTKGNVLMYTRRSRRFNDVIGLERDRNTLHLRWSPTNWKTAICILDEIVIFLGKIGEIYDRDFHFKKDTSPFPGRFVPRKALPFRETK